MLLLGVLIMGVMMFVIGVIFDKYGVKCLVIIGMFILIVVIVLFVFLIKMILVLYIVIFYVICMFGIFMVMMLVMIFGMNVLLNNLISYGIVVNNIFC